MKIGQDEILKLKRFCQEIIEKPRMIENQPHVRGGGYLWCEDWKMIEILKCLFLGEREYCADIPPKRLKRNNLWARSEICEHAQKAREKFETVDQLIENMREKRNGNSQEFIRYF